MQFLISNLKNLILSTIYSCQLCTQVSIQFRVIGLRLAQIFLLYSGPSERHVLHYLALQSMTFRAASTALFSFAKYDIQLGRKKLFVHYVNTIIGYMEEPWPHFIKHVFFM